MAVITAGDGAVNAADAKALPAPARNGCVPVMKAPRKRKKLDAPLHAAAVLDAVFSAFGVGPEHARLVQLWKNWSMVIGPEMTPLALPLGARRNLLLVGAPDSIALQELHLLSAEILERVNAFMECSFFTAVNIRLCFDQNDLSREDAFKSAIQK
ncbi:MAG: DUF721 domain-containing protein [Desulfovibrio sp.]|jgi:hypothetical protein|nr:DUF721 domain-containing protein [Desulfovibrio sp.]